MNSSNRFRFRLTTLFVVIAILSVLLAVGVQYPKLVITFTFFFPCLLISALAGVATKSGTVFAAGLLGGYLGYRLNPYRVLDSVSPDATWWDCYRDHVATAEPSIIIGAICAMVVTAIVRIVIERSRNDPTSG